MSSQPPALSLAEMQKRFMSSLQQPLDFDSSSLNLAIRGNSRMSQTECLAIYQRSYYARLLVCMREQFPALCYCLGEKLFDDFCKEYLKKYKPSSYTLYELGRRFPTFLFDSRPPQHANGTQKETWIDFMIDLARFEYDIFSLFDSHADAHGSIATLQTPDESLRLQKCFSLGAYHFDVAAYYHGVRNNLSPNLPPLVASKVALVRKEYLTHTVFLSDPHFHFLRAMQNGRTVKDSLLDVAKNFGLPFDQVLSSWKDPDGVRTRWIDSGIFVDKN